MVIYIAGSIPLFRGKRSNHFRLQRQSKHGAAHLHRDEETPHIHVTLVPIVKGERKRRKREEQTKKRYRKKPTDTVRLCADDIMTRLKLKSYQDTYAVAMAKYGCNLQIFLCLFLEKLNMPQNTPVTKAS